MFSSPEKVPLQKSVAENFNEAIRAGRMRAFEDTNGEVRTWTSETDTPSEHLLSMLSDTAEYEEVTKLIVDKSAKIEERDGKMVLRRSEKKQIERVRQFE